MYVLIEVQIVFIPDGVSLQERAGSKVCVTLSTLSEGESSLRRELWCFHLQPHKMVVSEIKNNVAISNAALYDPPLIGSEGFVPNLAN